MKRSRRCRWNAPLRGAAERPAVMLSNRGMTLLELLIAIALILALLGSLFGFFYDAVRSREHVIERTAKQRAAATLIDRIENDLLFAIAGDSRFGAGVSGTESSIRMLTRGVPAQFAERGANDGTAFRDLQVVEYRFSANSGIEARRSNAGADENGEFQSFGGSIFRTRFRYHDGVEWRDSFDSLESGSLPVAVEVAVWFHGWPGAEEEDEADDGLGADRDDVERERLTFESTGTFDESAWARRAERDVFRHEPFPDRVRVIVVPDAQEANADEG